MIDVDWKPNDRKLRQFALASLVGFPLIAFLLTKLLPSLSTLESAGGLSLVVLGAILGAVVCVLGWVFPRAVWPIYVVLVTLALPIGLALSWILIPLIYYGVFTPVALGLKLLGKDPLDRSFGRGDSYWIKRPSPPAAGQYYKQY